MVVRPFSSLNIMPFILIGCPPSMQYMLLAAVSTAMDITRLFLWNAYIQSKIVPYYTILGYGLGKVPRFAVLTCFRNYYTALLGFGMIIKVTGSLIAFFVYRSIAPATAARSAAVGEKSTHAISDMLNRHRAKEFIAANLLAPSPLVV